MDDVLNFGARVHPVTLRFTDAELEQNYQLAYAEKARRFVRITMVLGATLIAMSWVANHAGLAWPVLSDRYLAVFRINATVIFLLCCATFLVTFVASFHRIWQTCLVVFGFIFITTEVVTIAQAPSLMESMGFTFALLMIYLGLFTILPLRFILAVALGILSVLEYIILAPGIEDATRSDVHGIASYLIQVSILGCFAAYLREKRARREFVQYHRSEGLLLNVLPASIAERLKQNEQTIADGFREVTVLFADLAGFTRMSGQLKPDRVVEFLNGIFSGFDELCDKHGLEKIKTIGDAYMVAGGIPEERPDHAERVMAMAIEMIETIREVRTPTGDPLRMRIGINTGPVVAGVIGVKKFIYDLWGDTVNTASRMESNGEGGRIHVTESTFERLKHRYRFREREGVEIKGKGRMRTFFFEGKIQPAKG